MNTLKTSRLPLGLFLTGLLITCFFLYMAIPKSWEEATKTADDGTITLADDWARTIEKKKSKFEQHDLYVLVAAKNGYFMCKHCPAGKFYLKMGEVYRYGTTGNGKEGRGYYDPWLSRKILNYVHIMTADLTTVKIAETKLIGTYALIPENLSRPIMASSQAKLYWYRLVIPPGNNRLD